MSTKAQLWFWLALTILLAIHLVSLVNSPWLFQPPKPNTDGPDYENIGFNLARGLGFVFDWTDPRAIEVYQQSELSKATVADIARTSQPTPTTARPPLLPWLIAVVYTIVPRGPFAFATIRFILAICLAIASALAVYVSVAIAAKANQPRAIVNLAGAGTLLIAIGDRNTRNYSTDFLTEPLALLLTELLTICLLAWLYGAREVIGEGLKFSWRWYAIGVGVLLAAMIYSRSLFVFWLPGIWVLLWIGLRQNHIWKWPAGQSLLAIVVAGLCLAPWWIRNCLVLGAVMPLGTQGPITMLGGYSDAALAAGGDWQYAPEFELREELEQNPDFQQNTDPIERELIVVREASRRVRSWIAAHLADLPTLFGRRIVTHWNPYHGRSLLWKFAMIAGIAWLIVTKNRAAVVLIGLPLLNTVVVMMLYTTGGRFLVPLYGILYSLGGIGIAGCIAWITKFWVGKQHARSR